MQEAFCFAQDTLLPTPTGSIPIHAVQLGDSLLCPSGEVSKVCGKMIFKSDYEPLYDLYGVQVSGAHIYYEDGVPTFVKNARDAKRQPQTASAPLYCLITDNHKIPVFSQNGVLLFADWEELESDEDLQSWHKIVFNTLNKSAPYNAPSDVCLTNEAAISENAQVFTPLGPVKICNLHPGTTVNDANGTPTRVVGIVRLDSTLVHDAVALDDHTYISAGVWRYQKGIWNQPTETKPAPKNMRWYNLFTEAGSFRLATADFEDTVLRDFSDVGTDVLPETYEWVLESLSSQNFGAD
jgi:hypothetical protein